MPRPRFSTAISTGVFFAARPAVLAGRDAAEVALVDLYFTGELVAAGRDHRPPELVQPGPGGLVRAERERVLQAERADAVFLVGDVPGGREPERKRPGRASEDRPR